MPELDRVTIELSNRDVTITSEERRELLKELAEEHYDRPNGDPLVNRALCAALEDVGASGAVILTLEQKAHLYGRLEWWTAYTEVAPGLLELLTALTDDLRNDAQRRGR
jgi:hypothetical protein